MEQTIVFDNDETSYYVSEEFQDELIGYAEDIGGYFEKAIWKQN
jgi:hypothetical protein